ncbi:MAG: hypothetical protein ACTS45_02030 [Candidatus Hodgkinia cicadicola]
MGPWLGKNIWERRHGGIWSWGTGLPMWNGRVWRRSGSLGAEARRKWFAFMLKPGRRGVLSSKHVKLG